MMAEINNFNTSKSADIKAAHQKFLKEQIGFYQKVNYRAGLDAIKLFRLIIYGNS